MCQLNKVNIYQMGAWWFSIGTGGTTWEAVSVGSF